MNAIDRIKEIERTAHIRPFDLMARQMNAEESREFLLKAFRVMREIAIEMHKGKKNIYLKNLTIEDCVQSIFEKRMAEPSDEESPAAKI